ncbi:MULTISPECIES: carbohydrate ABC transporter permease [Paenibacillus]|jgi:putative aldouronate transport system permease protein|uniref:Carbohydrate ABC transporter membrane protein 2 (CUT1 family) n=2 Tax=Paenibacillus TaxID=44249 RepID=A0A855Y9H4_9BACL|nr:MULTISPECIES: carbohydrate ABC transporter permease [Paenibacillus]MBE7679380.1 ABC transporter permease subunit [Paenibacillus sp. P13VS]MCM3205226.1 carbohydrate ABC transporter permease [Paenibacillus illinoisensis]MEC0127970.1 carbohydrate ABC transporter permease [Paenibacillus pabuli]PWW39652.1 carbohydrate ABC transporter membrane protein 2 (CUT1 family) [Paenibacillus pabuli]PXW06882.1 carbohydrate ABC transporter membrane protein 2 (CUT1 family) [Paenibacillus taichungensis]
MYHKSTPYRVFNVINICFLILVAIMCIVPMIHVLAVSFSNKAAADANLVSLWPVGFSLEAYKKTMNNPIFLNSLWISLLRTVIGTGITLLITFLAAYPLSKENNEFKGRTVYSWIFVFSMIFNGGLVPFYMVIQKIGLMDSFWVLVLPGAVNTFLVILMLNFFRGIPKELEEAALMDGANHFRTLFSIFLPISMPSIATIALFSMVFHWNSWFDGLLYMNNAKDYPLATFMQTVIIKRDMSTMAMNPKEMETISQTTVRAAQIFIGSAPILIVYPFLQRFFVKGMTLGSVKG